MNKKQFDEFLKKYLFRLSNEGHDVIKYWQSLGPWNSGAVISSPDDSRYYLSFVAPTELSLKHPMGLGSLKDGWKDKKYLLCNFQDENDSEAISYKKATDEVLDTYLEDYRNYLLQANENYLEVIDVTVNIRNCDEEDNEYGEDDVWGWCNRDPQDSDPSPMEELRVNGNIYKTGLSVKVLDDGTKIVSISDAVIGDTGPDDCILFKKEKVGYYLNSEKSIAVSEKGTAREEVLEFVSEYMDSIACYLEDDGEQGEISDVLLFIEFCLGEKDIHDWYEKGYVENEDYNEWDFVDKCPTSLDY